MGFRYFRYLPLLALFFVPVAAWAFFKPVRVLAPELNGVSCPLAQLCTDDVSRIEQASSLYEEALGFVTAALAPMSAPPRVIFCAADACARAFGTAKRSAFTLGTQGIVISPRAWKDYYVRHEMIHHVQNEKLGAFKVWFSTPAWFREGMAYSLSADPRPCLAEPFQSYREQFASWYRQLENADLWVGASKL